MVDMSSNARKRYAEIMRDVEALINDHSRSFPSVYGVHFR